MDISLREEINMLRGPLPVLTYLGRDTPAPTSPDEAVIDRVPNRHPDTNYVVRFSAPEFTSLCAVTGQPDFAHFIIDYVPKAWLLESKSLKFFLASFRNHSSFHEECTIAIGKRLAAAIRPTYFRIARTGIRAAASRSTYSGKKENGRRDYACQIKASPLPVDADSRVSACTPVPARGYISALQANTAR